MTPLPRDTARHPFAIDELRHMVRNFGNVNENFLAHHSTAELLQIHRAWLASGWDISPEAWTDRQVREAKRGIVPRWDQVTERPVYGRAKP